LIVHPESQFRCASDGGLANRRLQPLGPVSNASESVITEPE
jgi:hypothetical protein